MIPRTCRADRPMPNCRWSHDLRGTTSGPRNHDRTRRVSPRLTDDLHEEPSAVAGNNDAGSLLPETVVAMVEGVTIAVVHDSGAAAGRTARLSQMFPDADVVVFGHSHLPWNEPTVVNGRPQIHFNPGSPTQRRRAPHRTVGWIDVDGVGLITCRLDIVGS